MPPQLKATTARGLQRDYLGCHVQLVNGGVTHGKLRSFQFFEHYAHVVLSKTNGLTRTYRIDMDAEVNVVVNSGD